MLLKPAEVAGIDVGKEVGEHPAVFDRRRKQKLGGNLLRSVGDHRPGFVFEGVEAVADEPRLAACGGRGLLLQDVVELEGLEPLFLRRMGQQQPGDAAAFRQHQRTGRDFGVVDAQAGPSTVF